MITYTYRKNVDEDAIRTRLKSVDLAFEGVASPGRDVIVTFLSAVRKDEKIAMDSVFADLGYSFVGVT